MSSNMASFSNNTSALSRLSAVAQHLVFTLLLLALGVTNAKAATETIFSLEVTATQEVNLASGADLDLASYATISRGTAIVHNGKSSAVTIIDKNKRVVLKGSSGTYLKITLASQTLQVGDIISIGTNQTNASFWGTDDNDTNGKDQSDHVALGLSGYTVSSSDALKGKSEFYVWNDNEGRISSLTITRPGKSYTYTINAKDGSNNLIKTIATGTVNDDAAVKAYHPKAFYHNGTFYKTDNENYEHTFAAATNNTAQTENVTYSVDNTMMSFVEGEDIQIGSTGNYSGGKSGYVVGGNPSVLVENLPAGSYTFYAFHVGDENSYKRGFFLRDAGNLDFTKKIESVNLGGDNSNRLVNTSFIIYSPTTITLSGYYPNSANKINQSSSFDYAYIVKTGDVIPVTSLSLNKHATTIAQSSNETLTATLTPAEPSLAAVTWSSTNTAIASVNESGQVTANAIGTAYIVAKANGGGEEAVDTCEVTVVGNKTVGDLDEFGNNHVFTPTETMVPGVRYDSNKVLSIGGNTYYNGGVRVKASYCALAIRIKPANQIVRVTYKNYGDNTRVAYVGPNLNGTGATQQSILPGATETVVRYEPSSGNNYCYIFANDNDLYVTKIEVLGDTYTVTFDAQSGSCATSSLHETKPAVGVTLPEATPPVNYAFIGWSTRNDVYATVDAGVAGDIYYPTGNIPLYALYASAATTLQSVQVNGHTLVATNNVYTYTVGSAFGTDQIDITITPGANAKAQVGKNISSDFGQPIEVTATVAGDPLLVYVTDRDNNKAQYTVRVNLAGDISVKGDSYALENKTYYEGQAIQGDHIRAYISPTAGGANTNSAYSNYGELTTVSQAYTGDIQYSYRLNNGNGKKPVYNEGTGQPSSGCFYAFTPTKDGVLEVAVNINANKRLIVSNGTKILTRNTDYTTSNITYGSGDAPSANVSGGSVRINVTAGTTYYVYGAGTKMGILGFALNEYLYVTSEGQEFVMSTDNYANYGYFTKENASSTTTHGDVSIYRIKNASDKVTVKVKGAKSVKAVIYNNTVSNRTFTISVDGSIVGTEAAHNGETESAYYTINENGSTITLAGTGSDIYAYKLIFSKKQYATISVKDGETLINSVTKFVDDEDATYSVTSNSSGAITVDASGLNGKATVTLLSNGTLTIDPTAYGTGNIVLSQAASDGYEAATRTIAVTIKRHTLKLTLTHNGNDSYSKNKTTGVISGSYYTGSNTPWTVTALKDGVKGQEVTGLTYTYVIDDASIATLNNSSSGAITVNNNASGTSYLKVVFNGDAIYEGAKANFSISITDGYDVKISSGTTPTLNSRYEAKRGSQVLCTMIAGGYKYNKGTVFGSTDGWGKSGPYDDRNFPCQIDGFIQQSQAKIDSRNEYNEKITWYESGVEGVVANERIKVFSLPVRGAYLKFEPEVNGVLTAYVLQNGDISMENDGGDGLPYEIGKAPRVYYWFDQDGYRVVPESYVSKLPLQYGRDYTKDGVRVFYDNGHGDHNLTDWYETDRYLQTLYETEGKWPTQAEVDANLALPNPVPQEVVRYKNGYSVHQKAYVKYVINVTAGNTYYFFANDSKVGFAGYNFKPLDEITYHPAHNENTTISVSMHGDATLNETSDNATKFLASSNTVNVYDEVTFNRSFKQDTWNTITLPFPLTETQVEKVFGVGTKLMIYNGLDGTTAHFIRHVDQNILAGQPYFIKPTGKDADGNNLASVAGGKVGGNGGLTFHNVNCDYKLKVQSYGSNSYSREGAANYLSIGTLAPTTVMNGDYYIKANDGNLYELQSNKTVQLNAYRSFLQKNRPNAAKISSVNFADLDGIDWEDEVTGIMEVLVNDMGVEIAPVQGVFNLNGQKVGDSTKGLPAGLYIVNGKVINIK